MSQVYVFHIHDQLFVVYPDIDYWSNMVKVMLVVWIVIINVNRTYICHRKFKNYEYSYLKMLKYNKKKNIFYVIHIPILLVYK